MTVSRRYRAGCRPLAIVHKARLSGADVEARGVVGEVRGLTPLAVDDILSTGGTVEVAVKALRAEAIQARERWASQRRGRGKCRLMRYCYQNERVAAYHYLLLRQAGGEGRVHGQGRLLRGVTAASGAA